MRISSNCREYFAVFFPLCSNKNSVKGARNFIKDSWSAAQGGGSSLVHASTLNAETERKVSILVGKELNRDKLVNNCLPPVKIQKQI